MYLAGLRSAYNPTTRRFGVEVWQTKADVITFNYDTIAEEAIASGSGRGSKLIPSTFLRGGRMLGNPLRDEDLDASWHPWRPHLAYGFKFDEVTLPAAGGSDYIQGDRYYSHPDNQLYGNSRILKLHGSINWLRYTNFRPFEAFEAPKEEAPPEGLVLDPAPNYWWAESPIKDSWLMEPVIIPPLLYKNFVEHPFRAVWPAALDALKECKTLIVVGYSFPPTDFRTRRLFLEAFSSHALTRLVVVNPDPTITKIASRLCHYSGQVETYNNLHSFYGVPASWLDSPAVKGGNTTAQQEGPTA
jgi:hypothetical protein